MCSVIDLELGNTSVTVSYDYEPEEEVVMYYKDGSGHPGCAATIDVIKIEDENGNDVTSIFEGLDKTAYVGEEVLKLIEN